MQALYNNLKSLKLWAFNDGKITVSFENRERIHKTAERGIKLLERINHLLWHVKAVFTMIPMVFKHKFSGEKIIGFLRRKDLHALTKYDLLLGEMFAYLGKDNETTDEINTKFWLHYHMKGIVNVAFIPIWNLFSETKLLSGRADGKKLIRLLKAGATSVYYYCGIDGSDSHYGSTRLLEDGTYLTNHSGVLSKEAILTADANDQERWWPGQERGITIGEIEEDYKQTEALVKDGKVGKQHLEISNFSTSLLNASCN